MLVNLNINTVKEITLNRINHLKNLTSEFKKQNLEFCIDGVIINLEEKINSNYSTVYDVTFKDATTDDFILINIPKDLIDPNNIKNGAYVQIVCIAMINDYNNILKLQFTVKQITPSERTVLDLVKQNDKLAILKSIARKRVSFPISQNVNIAIIRPKSDIAYADFKSQLPSTGVYTEEYVTDICDKQSILDSLQKLIKANATRSHKFNIVAILRGGTDGLEVFDDLDVCKAFASIEMHKIVGIGHENNRHLIDFVSDYSAGTPSFLITYINQQINEVTKIIKLNSNNNGFNNYKGTKQSTNIDTKVNIIIGLLIILIFIVLVRVN